MLRKRASAMKVMVMMDLRDALERRLTSRAQRVGFGANGRAACSLEQTAQH